MSRYYQLILPLFVAAIGACFSNSGQTSHPNHASNAEVSWNSKTGNFEVALSVWPVDLEAVLTAQQNQPVDLDKSDGVDAMIEKYIGKKFLIRKKPDTSSDSDSKSNSDSESVSVSEEPAVPEIRWVGYENNIKQAWLFFEIKTDEKTFGDWTIENRIFFELNEDQMNRVQFSLGKGASATVVCNFETPRQTLKAAKRSRFSQ